MDNPYQSPTTKCDKLKQNESMHASTWRMMSMGVFVGLLMGGTAGAASGLNVGLAAIFVGLMEAVRASRPLHVAIGELVPFVMAMMVAGSMFCGVLGAIAGLVPGVVVHRKRGLNRRGVILIATTCSILCGVLLGWGIGIERESTTALIYVAVSAVMAGVTGCLVATRLVRNVAGTSNDIDGAGGLDDTS